MQGGDIQEKKLTLPLIYVLDRCDIKKKKDILKKIRKGEKNKHIPEIISFVKDNGGIKYSQKIAEEYSQKAKDCLSIFQNSETKNSLVKLVDYVVEREK